jgi:adenine-specific DNA-methyltransferase
LCKFFANCFHPDLGAKEALLCLDVSIDPSTLKYLKTHKDLKFICLERALDTSKKWNLKQILGNNFFAF